MLRLLFRIYYEFDMPVLQRHTKAKYGNFDITIMYWGQCIDPVSVLMILLVTYVALTVCLQGHTKAKHTHIFITTTSEILNEMESS